MPFGKRTMAEQRASLVDEIKVGERSISALCREYGVSRPTAYKWLRRSERGGQMEDRSRAPRHSPNRTSCGVEDAILRTRLEHPCWGGRKLKAYLERKTGMLFPAASTVTAILQRNGLVSPEASRAATPYKRFEKERPNDLWQADFKGHFGMLDGNRCYPLTVTDDHSRYSLCISAKSNERQEGVVQSFLALFHEYGLPAAILSDNGNPWGSNFGSYTRFDVFLMDYEIQPLHGRPLHPQTQGKEERFHRTLKQELLAIEPIDNLLSAQVKFDAFRREYNEERPHHSLGYAVPADRYRASERIMPACIREWEYPQGTIVRKVNDSGYIGFNGRQIHVSEAFRGRKLALIASSEYDIVDVIYRNFMIAKMSLREMRVISKKIVSQATDA